MEFRSTVYYVNGDHYCGEWSANLRHGLGVMTYKKGDYCAPEAEVENFQTELNTPVTGKRTKKTAKVFSVS